MHLRLNEWLDFLSIDGSTREVLGEVSPLLERKLDVMLDAVYAVIQANPATRKMFANADSMARAKAAQRHHWQRFVFSGNFDDAYLAAARRIGEAHYRLGVDLRFYMGTYTLMLDQLSKVILEDIADDPSRQHRYLSAINRVTSLDMGISTTVYYDSQVDALRQMANELNFALASSAITRPAITWYA